MQSLKDKYLSAESYYNAHKEEVSESLKLKLYGLTKQAKEGDCRMAEPPSSNVILKAKWDAWTACASMPMETAMQEFSALVGKIEMQAKSRQSIAKEIKSGNRSSSSVTMKSPDGAAAKTAGTASAEKAQSNGATGSSNSVAGSDISNSSGGNISSNSTAVADNVSSSNSIGNSGGFTKQGTLYKQRDLFKGWRPRHFVLADCFLQYYIEPDDALPRNTLDLTGCKVATSKPVMSDGTEFFPFQITHSSKTFKVSSTSSKETEEWVRCIAAAINVATAAASAESAFKKGSATGSFTGSGGSLLRSAAMDETESTDSDCMLHTEETLSNIPDKYRSKIEMAVQSLLDAVEPNSPSWEKMYEKKGVVGKRRAGDNICVKGECVLPYHLQHVWSVLGDINRQSEVDPMQKIHERINTFSQHTWMEYLRFKEMWPTSARDFVTLVHWRVLPDQTVVLASFSEADAALRPEYEGVVRGDVILAGYVLRQCATGTQAFYIAQSDLKGKLPSTLTNMVAKDQPLALATIKGILDKELADQSKLPIDAPVNYEDLVRMINKEHAADAPNRSKDLPKPKQYVPPAAKKRPPRPKSWREEKLSAVALLTLFLPALLYYIVDRSWRAGAFFAGAIVVLKYLLQLHIGSPLRKVSTSAALGSVPSGRIVLQINVDLGRLLRYLDKKRAESQLEITITHVTVKACAMVLADMPLLNGHIVNGSFYRSQSRGVDVSLSFDVNEKESGVMKVVDADVKPVDYLSDEIVKRGKALREAATAAAATAADGSSGVDSSAAGRVKNIKTKIYSFLPPSFVTIVENFLQHLGIQYGISIPLLDVHAFPLGGCCVLTSPNVDGETDVTVSVIPDSSSSSSSRGGCSTPVIVSIGSVRVQPHLDSDRRVNGSPVLSYSVSFDALAGSMAEYRKFITRLQKYLKDPNLMDEIDKRAAFIREQHSKRQETFGSK